MVKSILSICFLPLSMKLSTDIFHKATLNFLSDIPKQDIKTDKNGKILNWQKLDRNTQHDIIKYYKTH